MLGQKLDKPVRTFGLNHAALVELVEELQEEVAVRQLAATDPPAPVLPGQVEEPQAAAEEPVPEFMPRPLDGLTGELAAAPVVVPPPAPPPRPHAGGYEVAAGKSITSLRGILGQGTPVGPKDFLHGQETIDHLVKRGTLVESKR